VNAGGSSASYLAVNSGAEGAVSQLVSPLRGSEIFSNLPRGLRPSLTAKPPLRGSFICDSTPSIPLQNWTRGCDTVSKALKFPPRLEVPFDCAQGKRLKSCPDTKQSQNEVFGPQRRVRLCRFKAALPIDDTAVAT
jgi:hypothetical protein